MSSWRSLGMVALVALASMAASPAGAQNESEEPLLSRTFRSRWEIGLAFHLAATIEGDRCFRDDDFDGCSANGYWAFEFAPRWRMSRYFAVGLVAPLARGDQTTLLRLGAEGRFYPVGDQTVTPSLGVDLGAALLIDGIPMSERDPSKTFVTAAPAMGASLAFDFALGETVSLGLSLRLAFLPLAGSDRFPPNREPTYDSQLILSGGLVGTYRFDS